MEEIKNAVFCLKNTNGMKRNPRERSAVPTTMYKAVPIFK
jgi:hypothetical protein